MDLEGLRCKQRAPRNACGGFIQFTNGAPRLGVAKDSRGSSFSVFLLASVSTRFCTVTVPRRIRRSVPHANAPKYQAPHAKAEETRTRLSRAGKSEEGHKFFKKRPEIGGMPTFSCGECAGVGESGGVRMWRDAFSSRTRARTIGCCPRRSEPLKVMMTLGSHRYGGPG